ncbi:MAG: class A beta-lactamase-related serine hydrolase [Actinomycetota bacterium]|nr:class A beta-lactamase-related serine hydrolase [Actinomycetota bacterium]
MRAPLLLAAAIAAALACAAPGAMAAAPTISLTTSPSQARSGQHVTLSGTVTPTAAGSVVSLYASPYPYPVAKLMGTTPTASDGSFSFNVSPDRNVRYRVALAGTRVAASASVTVEGKIVTRVRALPVGRAAIKVLVFHPEDLRWGGARVQWSFASGNRGAYAPAPGTRTVRLSPYVAVVSTTIALPAGRLRWRACFHAPGDHALLDPSRAPGCTGWGDHGGGFLPAGFPDPGAVSRAGSYLATRAGRTAFAVEDTEGRMAGVHIHWTFPTASVVKAMLLVAYLRRLDAMGQRTVDSGSNSFLYPMIHISDNNAATKTWSMVGDSGLYTIARAAGMTDFSVSGFWLSALLSPADQAHFFFDMDSLIPREFVGYARFLLSTIEPSQSWGIPVIARPLGYQTFFKDGSEPTGLGQLVHQVDRLEGHGRTFSVAVMTDGDPTMQYGIDTIQGVAAALLR